MRKRAQWVTGIAAMLLVQLTAHPVLAQPAPPGATPTSTAAATVAPAAGDAPTAKADASATPKADAPATPKPGAPATPKPGAPATPKPGAPATPKPGAPATPKPGAPATPKEGDAATPKEGDAATPKAGDAATPKEGDAATPKAGDAATPKAGDAATPKAGDTATAKEGDTAGKKPDAAIIQKAAEAKRLIKYGVTVGAAATVQLPWFGSNTLDEPVVAVMPYFAFLPAYWLNQPETNAYCAALWSGPAENAIAASKVIDKQIVTEGVVYDAAKADRTFKNETVSCAGRRLGIYVGYPAAFKATSSVPQRTATDTAKRDVSPIVSYGFAFVPNAVVTLLTGPSIGTVPRDDGTNAVVWSWTVGLGANVDLVNLIP
jgi:hypothetical protein